MRKIPLSEMLRKNSGYTSTQIKKRLIDDNIIKDKCKKCGWKTKFGNSKYSNCELHHKNGNNNDNRLNNLVLLCPNCHSQTDNYRGRNIGKRKFSKIKLLIIISVIIFILYKFGIFENLLK